MQTTSWVRQFFAATCYTIVLLAPCAWGQEANRSFKTPEIEQLVAPIALYPDALVAQMLMASTYPLEVAEAARWSKANPSFTGGELQEAMQQKAWDPSVKSLTAVPQALAMMSENIEWTQKLGDAFLGQRKDVMEAIQRLRAKAKGAGNLKSSNEQTVKTEQQGDVSVIVIEPTNPEVIYVPAYNPTVVYGAWPYPTYVPYYYHPPGYTAGAVALSFSVGVMVGSAMWGGANWGSSNVYINNTRYNNFNRTNVQNANWQHNPEHRRGAQYRDAADYSGGQRADIESREAYRGRVDATTRKDVTTSGASAFDGAGNGGEARAQSTRGAESLGNAGGVTRPAASPRAGAGGGRGGGGRR